MAAVQQAVSLGHALRKEHKLKVRQPLQKAHVVSSNPHLIAACQAQQHLICDELNVKAVEFHTDEKDFVTLLPKAHFRHLGKKVGKRMPEVKAFIEALSMEQIHKLQNGDTIALDGELIITNDDVLIDRAVKEGLVAASEGEVTLALDTQLTDELIDEALAREIVNKLNTMRRDIGLEVTDRIQITIESTPHLQGCFERHHDYITSETLITKYTFQETTGTKWDLNGEPATIQITKDG